MFVFGGADIGNGTKLNFNTLRSSVPAQSDSGGGAVSVGAINASDPRVDDIKPFSSRAPTNNGVIKPDVVAIDGVSVSGAAGSPRPSSAHRPPPPTSPVSRRSSFSASPS